MFTILTPLPEADRNDAVTAFCLQNLKFELYFFCATPSR